MVDIAETAVTMLNNNIVVNIEQCAHQALFNPVFINIARTVSSSVVHSLPGTSRFVQKLIPLSSRSNNILNTKPMHVYLIFSGFPHITNPNTDNN